MDKVLARCEGLASPPPAPGDGNLDRVNRLKALSKAVNCTAKAGRNAESSQGKTCKGTCPGEPLTFTRGPDSAASIDVKPVLQGTLLTYGVVLEDFVGLKGSFHYAFQSQSSISVSGSLQARTSFSNCLDVTVSGSTAFKTCADAAGFRRFSSISESINVQVEGQGSTRSSFMATASPPTVAFVDGLLPPAPSGSPHYFASRFPWKGGP